MLKARYLPLKSVGDLMVEKVVTVNSDESLREAVKLMDRENVGSIVVLEGDEIVGIITERDLLRLLARSSSSPLWKETQALEKLSVKDVMRSPVITCRPEATVEEALRIMNKNRIRHLPVAADGKLLGIISMRELSWAAIKDIASIFHHLFTSYTRILNQILGSGATTFIPYFIDELTRYYERRGFNVEGEDPQNILQSLGELLERSKIVEKAYVRQADNNRYLLEFLNCAFAEELACDQGSKHICPLSIIAATLLRKTTKCRVLIDFSTDGTVHKLSLIHI